MATKAYRLYPQMEHPFQQLAGTPVWTPEIHTLIAPAVFAFSNWLHVNVILWSTLIKPPHPPPFGDQADNPFLAAVSELFLNVFEFLVFSL